MNDVAPTRTVPPTSISDEQRYLTVCNEASSNDEAFAHFRRHPAYRRVLEHVTKEQGDAYAMRICTDFPWLSLRTEEIRKNDAFGDPVRYDLGSFAQVSPTTLRYANVVGDLVRLFGDLSSMKIVEVGGGYGGLAALICRICGMRTLTVVDLPPCLRLARRYLQSLQITDVRFLAADQVEKESYDLVISNYAFSECRGDAQAFYLEKILRRSKRGYLTCNQITPRAFGSLTRNGYLHRIPGSQVLPEIPQTHPRNFVVVWGQLGAGQ